MTFPVVVRRLTTTMCALSLLFGFHCNHADEEGRPTIVINEFMADNRGTIARDGFGEADDWIELHNYGAEPCSTGQFFCSDDSLQLARYTLPDTALPPGGYLLIWADGSPEQGPFHAPFRLSAEYGEEIILSDSEGRIVDRIQFFPHNNNPVARVPDRSYGRIYDGDTLWVQQITPTPGAPNTGGRR